MATRKGLNHFIENNGLEGQTSSEVSTVSAGVSRAIVKPSVADIPDEELLRRAVLGARISGRGYSPRWVAVADAFALGSTYSAQLCIRFGLDPDEKVRR